MKKLKLIITLFIPILIGFFISGGFLFASETNGTIDSTYKYAWGENIGWINFNATNGDINITDSGLSGYALSENVGWINLSDVVNDGEGNLSGYAWAENVGYIKFNPDNSGVVINSSGEFTGSALGENIGWIIFGGDYKVKTDWRPQSARSACNNSLDDDGDTKIDYPADPGCSSLSDTDETDPSHNSSGSYLPGYGPNRIINNQPIVSENKTETIVSDIWKEIKKTPVRIVKNIIPDFLKHKVDETKITKILEEKLVSENIPLALKGNWNLLPSESINNFVLAPLPKEIRKLAQKFPELGKTFKKIGINKITDVIKLRDVDLNLPGLTERSGLAFSQGVPISELSAGIKKKIPTEIVFAKTGGELIDFNIGVSVNEDGSPEQKIKTIVGKPLKLVLKPDHPVKSIKGYVVLKSKNDTNLVSLNHSLDIPSNSLLASAIFASPAFVKKSIEPIKIEEKLLLLEFEYTDPDKDGIYTAEIEAPLVDGEYEIITVLNFNDPELGSKEIRLTTVIDPEGYVYESYKDKEIRIPNASISIYYLNNETSEYELWNASKYQQKNPQKTNKSGDYSFLVPEGKYYIEAKASGYTPYTSEIFEVNEGNGIHFNLELKSKSWWLKVFDWKTFLLIGIIILLLYNFYRDKIRDRVMKLKKF